MQEYIDNFTIKLQEGSNDMKTQCCVCRAWKKNGVWGRSRSGMELDHTASHGYCHTCKKKVWEEYEELKNNRKDRT